MAAEGFNIQKIRTKIEGFYEAEHLNRWMGKIQKWNKQKAWSGKLKARGANVVILSLDLGGMFFNLIKAPFLTATQPAGTAAYSGISLVDRLIRLSKPHTYKAKTRRKFLQTFPKIQKHIPTVIDLARTVEKVFKYVAAFFLSLTFGFLFVGVTLRVYHHLGLISISRFAKKDRERSILNTAKRMEGSSLRKARFERYAGDQKSYEKKIEAEVEKKLREKVFGHTEYLSTAELLANDEISQDIVKRAIKIAYENRLNPEEHPEITQEDFENLYLKMLNAKPDPNSQIRIAINEATKKKRNKSKALEEQKLGRALKSKEFEQIQWRFWKTNLSQPFACESDGNFSQENEKFLSRYFNWQDHKNGNPKFQCFPFKSQQHFEDYLKEYYRWNLTPVEAKKVLKKVYHYDKRFKIHFHKLKKIQKASAYVDAERAAVEEKRKHYSKVIKIEREFADFDGVLLQALKSKSKEIKANLREEKRIIKKRVRDLVNLEKRIIYKTRKKEQPLDADKINRMILKREVELSQYEREGLYSLAQNAVEILNHSLDGKKAEWNERLTASLSATIQALEDEYATTLTKEQNKIRNQIRVVFNAKNDILMRTREKQDNLDPEQLEEILQAFKTDFDENEIATSEIEALYKYAEKLVEDEHQREKDAQNGAKELKTPHEFKRTYKLKQAVMRQLLSEFPHSQFNRPQYNLKENVNVDQEIWDQLDDNLDEILNKEIRLRKSEPDNARLIQPHVLENMRYNYHALEPDPKRKLVGIITPIEKQRLYEQLLLKKMFPAVTDNRKFKKTDDEKRVKEFKGLEEAQEDAFEAIKALFYEEREDEIKPRNIIEEKLYRKENTENKPIDKDEKLLPNMECGDVTLNYTQDDDEETIKISFKGHRRLQNPDGTYVPREQNDAGEFINEPETRKEFVFEKLDHVAFNKKWEKFKAGSEGYPAIPASRKYILSASEKPLPRLKEKKKKTVEKEKSILRSKIFQEAAKTARKKEEKIHQAIEKKNHKLEKKQKMQLQLLGQEHLPCEKYVDKVGILAKELPDQD